MNSCGAIRLSPIAPYGLRLIVLQQWHAAHGQEDESLAIDGKTMKNAIDKEGRQTHIMSAVGHQTKACYTQKKSVLCP